MKKKKLYLTIGLISLVIVILAVSYAFYLRGGTQSNHNQLSTLQCLSTTLTDENGSLNMIDEFPISNEEGMEKSPYSFTITNNCDEPTEVIIGLESLNTSTLQSNYVVASVNRSGSLTNQGFILTTRSRGESLSGGTTYNLLTDTINGNQSRTYDLRIWMAEETTEAQGLNKTYSGKIVVTQKTRYGITTEAETSSTSTSTTTTTTVPVMPADTSGANEPLLADNMIPVAYDETRDAWVKANKDDQTSWYDYDNQIWANAVTVTEPRRTIYNDASAGTEIIMSDILGMWVWIPRFEYKIDHPGLGKTVEEIHVNYISGTSTTTTANYLIHPAFRKGSVYKHNNDYDLGGWDKELTGFWYGKFQTGYASSFSFHQDLLSNNILIKPSTYGVNWQNVSAEFATAQNVQIDHGIGSQLETHMGKNDEWGAVAYLSNSKYGKYGNPEYTGGDKEVYVNNAYYSGSKYITGRSNGTYGGGTESGPSQYGTYEYNNCPSLAYTSTPCDLSTRQNNATKGTGASTTGNIYGVYDMAGGLNEYTMGVLQYNASYIYTGTTESSNSGFTGYYETTLFNGTAVPNQKYFNRYTSSDLSTACNGVACPGIGWSNETGDGTATTTAIAHDWYDDGMGLPSSSFPWVVRGYSADYASRTPAGVLYSFGRIGSGNSGCGFRVVAA